MDTATLNDLIEVLHDGKNFYEEAAVEVQRADLKTLFDRMVRTKQAIIDDLTAVIDFRGGEPATVGSFAGALRAAYADVRTKFSSHKDYEYVVQLEEFEDRILHAFKNAVLASEDQTVRALATRHLPEVTRDHDEMCTLKQLAQH
jgi:uncharacterized protein (TIGR02284 family)